MKFCILCIGSHGDIRPYVALGVELKRRGHDVCIASHKKGQTISEKYGLNFKLVDGDLTELIDCESNGQDMKDKRLVILKIMKAFQNVLKLQLPMSLEAAQNAEVLIYSPAAFAGPHLAEFLKIPSFVINLQPSIKTRYYPSYLFPNQKYLLSWGHFLCEQMLWQPIRSHINKWRTKHLGIRKVHFLGPQKDRFCKNLPRLVAFSPSLLPRPLDWPSHVHMTGFCRLHEGNDWSPSQELELFLSRGSEPIYLGFGSLTGTCSKLIVEQIIHSLGKMNLRAIVQSNLPGLEELSLPSNIFPLNYAPHDWLFPRVQAVVHHGGVGTLAAGLYSGLPTFVMPFVWDQFYWGKMAFDKGFGPMPLSITEFDQQRFEQRIDDLLHCSTYRKNATTMKTQLNNEPEGVEAAADHIMSSLIQVL